MPHPDCSACSHYLCERAPDIFDNCFLFKLAPGKKPIPPQDWRPNWKDVSPEDVRKLNEADARHGLPECNARWEEAVDRKSVV